MSVTEHFSDDQIQEYLDGLEGALSIEESNHFEECPSCKKKLEQYRFLVRAAVAVDEIRLPVDFSEAVSRRAFEGHSSVESQIEQVQSRVYTWYLPIAASIVAVLSWAFAVGWDIFWSTALSGFLAGYNSITQPLEKLTLSQSLFGGNMSLLVAAGLLIVLFGSMDKIIRAARKTRQMVLSII